MSQKIGLIDRATPILFEPDDERNLPPAWKYTKTLDTRKRGNCEKMGIYVMNTSALAIILKGRTELGVLQLLRLVMRGKKTRCMQCCKKR